MSMHVIQYNKYLLQFKWFYPKKLGKLYPRWISPFYFGFNKSFKPWFKLVRKQLFPKGNIYLQIIILGIHYGECIQKEFLKEN